MEDQLISPSTAKLASKKGYPQKTSFYNFENVDDYKERRCSQSILQRWLREEHDIKVYLVWYNDKITEPRWSIYVNENYIDGNINYEKALEIGLLEGLKLINEKE